MFTASISKLGAALLQIIYVYFHEITGKSKAILYTKTRVFFYTIIDILHKIWYNYVENIMNGAPCSFYTKTHYYIYISFLIEGFA